MVEARFHDLRHRFEERPTVPRGPVVAGRYARGGLIGEGGMASVYRAVDLRTHRHVALKELRPSTSIPDARPRFEREIRMMAAVQHPNCARLLGHGDGPTPFAVLELIEGQDLRDAMVRPLPAPQVLELSLQLLMALGAVHRQQIIHRDIKSENVMLTRRRDGSDRVVLIDFGAATTSTEPHRPGPAQPLTRVGQMIGTPSAMSPEQFRGEPASFSSDLYAVGVLMFEMLTEHPPFPDEDLLEIMMAKSQPPPPLPSSVPPAVGWVVRALLDPDPQRRPRSCDEAIEAVMYARDALRLATPTTTWFDLLPVKVPLRGLP